MDTKKHLPLLILLVALAAGAAHGLPRLASALPAWWGGAPSAATHPMPAPVMCAGGLSAPTAARQAMTSMPWSDPATWGGIKPVAGEAVTIPEGIHILLDETPPALGGLTVAGTLTFDRQNLALTAEWILVTGSLHVGSEMEPFMQQATITLTGGTDNMEESIMGMGTRGLMVMGGTLHLHGVAPSPTWAKINAHAPAGSTALTMEAPVGWSAGQQVAIAPTDYYEAGPTGNSVSQRLSLTSVSGASLGLDAGLNAHRWGLLQYATQTGMSLTNTNPVTPPSNMGSTPTVLDERAPVGNLTRNIVVQAPDDARWQAQGFGCHIMVMRMGAVQGAAYIDGVEIRRGGQAGRLGRYPFHWHMLSYDGAQTLADATGQYIRHSTVNVSTHRGLVIHGTNGVEVSHNVLYDIRGHGIFFEDGSERRNLIDGNLVMRVRNPAAPIKGHEAGERGASGFWISNPDNTIVHNTAADCGHNGFWLAFPEHPWGESIQVPLNPSRMIFGVFDNNTAHSNRREGIQVDFPESDPFGNVAGRQYFSTTDGQIESSQRFLLNRYKTWKNGGHGVWDRAGFPDNFECVSADNCGRFFAGSGAEGVIARCLIVGTSLNHGMNGTDRPNFTGEVHPTGVATYHSEFYIRYNIFINFEVVPGQQSGAFATNDYYIRPVEKGQIRNVGNLRINAHPGVKIMAGFPYFSLAGALHDPDQIWGGNPAHDNYLVYDTPFFTHGQVPSIVAPGSAASGGVLVQGPFYGFNDFVVNNANLYYEDFMAINVTRLDAALNPVGTWALDDAPYPEALLAHMRHFATHPTGIYTLDFPSIPEVTDVGLLVENMLTTDDYQVLGIAYSGGYAIEQVFSTTMNHLHPPLAEWPTSFDRKHIYAPVGSLQAVLDAPEGEVYWHDTQNHRVWMKIRGGITQGWQPGQVAEYSDEALYRPFHIRVWGQPAQALPVTLTDFTARPDGPHTVQVAWATADEADSEAFTVERSPDGRHWTPLHTTPAQGHSSAPVQYAFADRSPLPGTSYYRLRQTDRGGQWTLSRTVAVVRGQATVPEVYPNPARDVLHIRHSATPGTPTEVEVYDLAGRLMMRRVLEGAATLDVSALPDGPYTLRLHTPQGGHTSKVVVRR